MVDIVGRQKRRPTVSTDIVGRQGGPTAVKEYRIKDSIFRPIYCLFVTA